MNTSSRLEKVADKKHNFNDIETTTSIHFNIYRMYICVI